MDLFYRTLLRILSIAVFVICFSDFFGVAAAFNEPEDFKGVKWGSTRDEGQRIIEDQWRERGVKAGSEWGKVHHHKRPDGRLSSFWFWDDIGEAKNVQFDMYFLDDKFVAVQLRFPSGYFSLIEGAFLTRYETPSSVKETEVQNRAGAKFMDKVLTWIGPNLHMQLSRYSGTLTHGGALIAQPEYVRFKLEETKSKTRDAAKGL